MAATSLNGTAAWAATVIRPQMPVPATCRHVPRRRCRRATGPADRTAGRFAARGLPTPPRRRPAAAWSRARGHPPHTGLVASSREAEAPCVASRRGRPAGVVAPDTGRSRLEGGERRRSPGRRAGRTATEAAASDSSGSISSRDPPCGWHLVARGPAVPERPSPRPRSRSGPAPTGSASTTAPCGRPGRAAARAHRPRRGSGPRWPPSPRAAARKTAQRPRGPQPALRRRETALR